MLPTIQYCAMETHAYLRDGAAHWVSFRTAAIKTVVKRDLVQCQMYCSSKTKGKCVAQERPMCSKGLLLVNIDLHYIGGTILFELVIH